MARVVVDTNIFFSALMSALIPQTSEVSKTSEVL